MGKKEIREAIMQIAGNNEAVSYVAKVVKVSDRTCDVQRLMDDKLIEDVRLNCEGSDFVIKPTVGSMIVITQLQSDTDHFVSAFSKIDSITLTASNDVSLTTQSGKIEIANNTLNLGGLLDELIDAIMLITVTAPSTGGTTTVPANLLQFETIQTKIKQLLK